MNPDEVTAQILDAWDDIVEEETGQRPEASVVEEEPDEERDQEETAEEAEEDEETDADEEPDDDEAETETEEEDTEEEVVAQAPSYEDIEIQAFLAKYDGDVEKALKGASELSRLMGRRDDEKAEIQRQLDQARGQLAQLQAFGGAEDMLTEDQQAWVENAAESANPGHFVQQAVQAGEFGLARAVCREWANVNPYEAMRAGQIVDAVEVQMQEQQAQPEPIPPARTWEALSANYPELRQYEQQMVQALERLGSEHPLVQEARSTDPNVAVRGIFGIYEIAKASTFALAETKNGLKKKRRQDADDAIDNAAVTSAAARPSSSSGTPRQRLLMPGLTQEDLDSAFDAELARQ